MQAKLCTTNLNCLELVIMGVAGRLPCITTCYKFVMYTVCLYRCFHDGLLNKLSLSSPTAYKLHHTNWEGTSQNYLLQEDSSWP